MLWIVSYPKLLWPSLAAIIEPLLNVSPGMYGFVCFGADSFLTSQYYFALGAHVLFLPIVDIGFFAIFTYWHDIALIDYVFEP